MFVILRLERLRKQLLYFDLKDAVCFHRTNELDCNGNPVIQKSLPKAWELHYGVAQEEYSEQLVETYDSDGSFTIQLPVSKEAKEELAFLRETEQEALTDNSEAEHEGFPKSNNEQKMIP